MSKISASRLREGDVLQKGYATGDRGVWQVAAILEPYGIRHARLRLASDPTVVKTLSIDSILAEWRLRPACPTGRWPTATPRRLLPGPAARGNDRKRAGWGKGVGARCDPGGCRFIK